MGDEKQCACDECDCDLVQAYPQTLCIACANDMHGSVPRCGNVPKESE